MRNSIKLSTMDDIARETGKTVPQIALSWLLQCPTIASVIVGARDEAQLTQNLGPLAGNLQRTRLRKSTSPATPLQSIPIGISASSLSVILCRSLSTKKVNVEGKEKRAYAHCKFIYYQHSGTENMYCDGPGCWCLFHHHNIASIASHNVATPSS